jgi:hypothetical protein
MSIRFATVAARRHPALVSVLVYNRQVAVFAIIFSFFGEVLAIYHNANITD